MTHLICYSHFMIVNIIGSIDLAGSELTRGLRRRNEGRCDPSVETIKFLLAAPAISFADVSGSPCVWRKKRPRSGCNRTTTNNSGSDRHEMARVCKRVLSIEQAPLCNDVASLFDARSCKQIRTHNRNVPFNRFRD
jgi:hypothetical protein